MNRHAITEEELKDRAEFFTKKFFGINLLCPVHFFETKSNDLHDIFSNNTLGLFIYSTDDGSIYRSDDSDIFYLNEDDKYNCKILINKCLAKNITDLNETLIHELIHYYLWYLGYNHGDNEADFVNKARELGISNNYEYRYDIKDELGGGTKNCDYDKLKKYERAYQYYKRKSA